MHEKSFLTVLFVIEAHLVAFTVKSIKTMSKGGVVEWVVQDMNVVNMAFEIWHCLKWELYHHWLSLCTGLSKPLLQTTFCKKVCQTSPNPLPRFTSKETYCRSTRVNSKSSKCPREKTLHFKKGKRNIWNAPHLSQIFWQYLGTIDPFSQQGSREAISSSWVKRRQLWN